MAGNPPNYSSLHLAFHSWMLQGDPVYNPTQESGNYTIDTSDGIAGLTNSLLSDNLGGDTPYANTTPFNPNASTELIRKLVQDGVEFLESLEDLGNIEDIWSTYIDAAETKIDTLYDSTKIASLVTAFDTRRRTYLQNQQAELDVQFAHLGAVETSSRIFALAALEIEHERVVDEFEAKQYLELENQKFQAINQTAQSLLQLRFQATQAQGQLISILNQTSALDMEAKRQYVEDDLRLRLEDAIWDYKIWGFTGQALSAISGASVIPASPNKTLEALSSVAGIAGVLISGIAAAKG